MADPVKPNHDSKIERALLFIENNLDRPLNLDKVAAEAAISRHHFHRLFSACVGMPVGRYIREKRFKRACFQLAFHHDKPVTDIAFDAQYATPEAFSKAFAKSTGTSPRQFRENPDFSVWSHPTFQKDNGDQSMEVDIVSFEQTHLAILEHKGPLNQVSETLQKFVAWRKKFGPSPRVSRTFNIYYDDPELVAAQNYRMDVGAELLSTLKPNDFGIVKKTIPDLTCARLRCLGSWDLLGPAMRQFYSHWLPKSDFMPDSFPMFVHRVNLFPEVPEHELITDIYLPVLKKTDV